MTGKDGIKHLLQDLELAFNGMRVQLAAKDAEIERLKAENEGEELRKQIIDLKAAVNLHEGWEEMVVKRIEGLKAKPYRGFALDVEEK